MLVIHVVGARPNFMKVAPIMAEMALQPDVFQQVLVHTGQHYDVNMSDVFFRDLGMRAPDEFLGVGSGSHAQQTARVMMGFEPVVEKHRPDWVLVVGDVNSTMACALVAAKLGVRIAHVEAGLRSGDWSMPEEINRVVTDRISDLLFTPSADADANLAHDGIDPARVHRVGNVMIDSLVRLLPSARRQPVMHGLGLSRRGFALVTLHRPANVDDPEGLREILQALAGIAQRLPVVFAVHPRTRKVMEAHGLGRVTGGVRMIEPLGYLDFLCLTDAASVVITDSGGIQEETSYLGIPCVTVRPNTERPVTVELGTNRLVGATAGEILSASVQCLQGAPSTPGSIPLWDGKASSRIAWVMGNQSPR